MVTQKPSNTVYISNLSYERDRNGLKSLFAKYGEIKNIKIVVEPKTNQSRGMAFIEMANIEQAKLAIENLNGKILDGRTAKAKFATPLKETSTSRFHANKKPEKDLEYKTKQLEKKARNDAKRKAVALPFKLAPKKKA